ncbi:MAG: N-acetyltransferase [Planctomycetota bacterium]
MPTYIIRAELQGDETKIRTVNERAFEQADEADLVDRLRTSGVSSISLVASYDNDEILGHILFTPVVLASGEPCRAMGLAPMSVLPDHQRQGIGSDLVRHGLEECETAGIDFVVVLGHPEFYPRFGFVTAATKGLSCEYPVPEEAFMVRELRNGSLDSIEGLVLYRDELRG